MRAGMTLWVVTALAAAQLAVLLARHLRGGRHRVPGGGKGLLVLAAVLACFLVVVDADPDPGDSLQEAAAD